jgi:hypothetical protein
MKLSPRSYPHPVLGNSDDVPGVSFQATIKMTLDKENIFLSINITCSSAVINRLVVEEKAKAIIHVECGNTFYRQVFNLKNLKDEVIAIQREDLNNEVEVNTFVVATDDISDYVVDGANDDYAGAKFAIQKGDILAKDGVLIFDIDTKYDAMNSIASFIKIKCSDIEADTPIKTNDSNDSVFILLSKNDFSIYNTYKKHPAYSGLMSSTLVLPVLVDLISQVSQIDDPESDERRWVRILSRKLDELQLPERTETLVKAQKILELPIQRDFMKIKASEENN